MCKLSRVRPAALNAAKHGSTNYCLMRLNVNQCSSTLKKKKGIKIIRGFSSSFGIYTLLCVVPHKIPVKHI